MDEFYKWAMAEFYKWVKVKHKESFLSNYEIGLMLDAFKAGCKAKRNDAMDFVIQYLYSEHQICAPTDEAAPYQPDELKKMAIKILSSR